MNNSSSCFIFIYHKNQLFFTGDAEQVSKRAILERYGHNLASTILKVASWEFHQHVVRFRVQVRPEVAIFQWEKGNTYDFLMIL